MIVAKEHRHIGWHECAPALRKSYEAGLKYGTDIHDEASIGKWTMAPSLRPLMKGVPLQLRLSPGFFFIRGMYDGLRAEPNEEAVEIIVAAFFPGEDDADRYIAPVEIEAFLSENFPVKGSPGGQNGCPHDGH